MPSRRPLLALLLALLPRFSAFDMYRPWNSVRRLFVILVEALHVENGQLQLLLLS